MDTTVIFIAVAIAVVARIYFSSPNVIGALGEYSVNSRLGKDLDEDQYVTLKDLTLPSGTGTTQVDHVVISRFGIFVIETKNMKGWIFGGEKQARWTQTLHKKKSQFQNPLRQNYKHVKTIQDLLSLTATDIHNIVVFTGSAVAKTEMPPNVLWSTRQLSSFIKSKRNAIFSQAQVAQYVSTLQTAALPRSRATNRTHVQNVKNMARPKATHTNACPKCSSAMVERKNKKTGDRFLGCSNFPKCKTTKPYVLEPQA